MSKKKGGRCGNCSCKKKYKPRKCIALYKRMEASVKKMKKRGMFESDIIVALGISKGTIWRALRASRG